ncbi:MAG: TatD family hydrolase, partial [Anaerolineales bacterium]|nr:TatD family hydrolase [Anaerolineales bacterium]
MIDSHAHVGFQQFDPDRGAVLERARQAGLSAIVEAGADLASSRSAVALAEQHRFIYAAVGVHPHDAQTVSPAALAELRALAQRPKVVAVGEIGLDYYRDLSPRAAQRAAFASQLALAAELDLPVIVHVRDAYADALAMIGEWCAAGPHRRGVIHAYSGGPERLDQIMALPF